MVWGTHCLFCHQGKTPVSFHIDTVCALQKGHLVEQPQGAHVEMVAMWYHGLAGSLVQQLN